MESGRKTNQFVPREPCKWTEFMHLRKTGRERNVPYFDKLQTAKLVQKSGFRTAKILHVFDGPCSLDFSSFPDAFVLKPAAFSGRKGVMLLHRCDDTNKYWEAMENRWLTLDMIRLEQFKWQELWYKHRKKPFQFIVEEMIVGENGSDKIPFDYKLFTFDGDVRLIIQVDRNIKPRALAWFLGDFQPFEARTRIETNWTTITQGKHQIPKCHKEIINMARKISMELATPFVSVDTYTTAAGPVIGELELSTGGPYRGYAFSFKPQFDKELGSAWAQANHRLGRETPLLDTDPDLKPPPIYSK